MADALALAGHKTLVVDLDPQGNATSGLGVRRDELEASVYQVLTDEVPAAEAVQPTQFEQLSLLAANIDLAGAELELVQLEANHGWALPKAAHYEELPPQTPTDQNMP